MTRKDIRNLKIASIIIGTTVLVSLLILVASHYFLFVILVKGFLG